jgi:hypothetical protein
MAAPPGDNGAMTKPGPHLPHCRRCNRPVARFTISRQVGAWRLRAECHGEHVEMDVPAKAKPEEPGAYRFALVELGRGLR